MDSYIQVESQYQWGYYILCGILFLFFPILGIITASLFAIKIESKQLSLYLIVLLVMYLSALNTTKIPESDMVNYIDMFCSVPKNGYYRTLTYLSESGTTKDAGYASLVYLMYYILSGNQYLFIFLVSIFTFLFFLLSIYKFSV